MAQNLLEGRNIVTITVAKGKYEKKREIRVDSAEVSEGGWGYVVVFALSIIELLMTGPATSLGILFHDFLHEHGAEKDSAFIFITSMNMGLAVSGIGSFITSIALKWFTVRQIALFGTLVILSGDIFGVLMTQPFHLILIYGLIRGFALGILFSTGFLVLNSYFVKKRTSMTSLAQMSVCLGGIIFPSVTTALLDRYGFKGCMLLILGLDLHLLFAVLLLVPAKPIVRSLKAKIVRKRSINIEIPRDKEHFESLKTLINKTEKNPAVYEPKTGNIKIENHKPSIWLRIMRFCNLNLLADPIFINIAMGLSLSKFADNNFKFIEPLLLYSYGLQKSQVAICITAGGVADFLSRFIMTIVTFYIKTSPRFLYFIVLCLSCASRLVFLISDSFMYVTIMTAVIGFVRSWIGVLYSLIIANYVAQDKFPAAYGLLVMITGITMFIGGPIAGIIQNLTGGYVCVVYALTFCNAINISTWMIEYFYTRKYKKTVIVKT